MYSYMPITASNSPNERRFRFPYSIQCTEQSRTGSGVGISSLKHSTSFRVISSNQKLAQALTSAPKAMDRINSSCCLATSRTNTAGSAGRHHQLALVPRPGKEWRLVRFSMVCSIRDLKRRIKVFKK